MLLFCTVFRPPARVKSEQGSSVPMAPLAWRVFDTNVSRRTPKALSGWSPRQESKLLRLTVRTLTSRWHVTISPKS